MIASLNDIHFKKYVFIRAESSLRSILQDFTSNYALLEDQNGCEQTCKSQKSPFGDKQSLRNTLFLVAQSLSHVDVDNDTEDRIIP
jgi:hypothetical protein